MRPRYCPRGFVRTVGDEAAEIPADDAMPSRALALIELVSHYVSLYPSQSPTAEETSCGQGVGA